ncbi:MAG TPA: hypothetical protein VGF94_25715, partial [Kofleriaceae bacterium]
MNLSSDDLPMFFEPDHVRLAERLRDVARDLEELERASASDGAIVGAIAGLFDLVAPASGKVDARAVCLAREA